MSERFLMKGNEAVAEAAIRVGCRCYFGYPITPQTEIAAYMSKHMKQSGGVFLQAESEIAAINMVLGAAAVGARAMTSSSSPGISLKSEAISYIAGSDLPCVIINVQRAGPGLGGIQPSQADYFQATRGLGHGDFYLMVFAPSTIQESVDIMSVAFDLSEKYRVPCFILSDGIIGQMMEPVSFPKESSFSFSKKDWALTGTQGKRSPNIINSLILSPQALEKSIQERFARYELIKKNEVQFESYLLEDADIAVVAFGAAARMVKSAVNEARQNGIKVGLFRPISLWPFPSQELLALKERIKHLLGVEMNMGQMVEDVKLAVNGTIPVTFYGRTGGCIPSPEEIIKEIITLDKKYKTG